MRKFLCWLAVLAGFFAFGLSAQAQEVIYHFDVQAALSAERHLVVTESIDYDFGSIPRHGIYRVIPNVYGRSGAQYSLRIKFLGASMDGQIVPWIASNSNGQVRIQIGDAGKTISGPHRYVLRYETDRAVNDFPDYQELYWNVTGNDWQISIWDATFDLQAPGPIAGMECFTGIYGSAASDCTTTSTGNLAKAQTSHRLGPFEGLTVVVSFPPGTFPALTLWEKLWQFAQDNLVLFLSVAVFLFMFAAWFLWGREPRGRGTIIAQYEAPEGLAPAHMAALMEQKVSARAVTATILDLARRGYLKMSFVQPRTFTLTRLTPPANGALADFEQTVLQGLFIYGRDQVSVADVKGKFWQNEQTMRGQVFDDLRERGLFGKNPAAVRAPWMLAGFVFVFATLKIVDGAFGPAFTVSGLLSAAIIIAFGWQMPRMTKQGAIVKEEVEGFKRFLSVTEKARLDFSDAPERTPQQFEAYLPAAVAFGIEQKWAAQFAGIDMRPPSYIDGPVGVWNALYFASMVTQLHQASAAGMYRAPSSAGSGGSGFSGGGSGGGFGGGGGGSW